MHMLQSVSCLPLNALDCSRHGIVSKATLKYLLDCECRTMFKQLLEINLKNFRFFRRVLFFPLWVAFLSRYKNQDNLLDISSSTDQVVSDLVL